jgi:hypothetical protein
MKNKRTSKNQDYVGPYDGSKETWTTRTMTDKGGNKKKAMVPATSKPQEAFEFFEHHQRDNLKK